MLAAAQVRQHVSSLLQACALTAGRVFEGRYHPVTEGEMPCWFVSITDEPLDAEGITWPRVQTHRLQMVAEGFIASADALETGLDTLQVQALEALFTTQPPWQLRCAGIRRRVADAEGQAARIGVLTLYLEATFLTVEGQPQNLIP